MGWKVVAGDTGGPRSAAARVQFETLFIDKGELPLDQETATYTFAFRNLGASDLLIEKVRTSCGCLGSTKPDDPIPPGGRGEISLTYQPSKRGPFTHHADVHSNDPCVPVIKLTAAGNTERRMQIDPPELDLGRVILGRTTSATCFVRYLGDKPLEVSEVTCDLPRAKLERHQITAERIEQLRANKRVMPKLLPDTHAITLSYTPEVAADEPIQAKITLRTNIKGFEQVAIPVKAEVIAPVFLAPDVLFFGEIGASAEVAQTVTVLSRSGQPFAIASVDVNGSDLKCTYPAVSTPARAELRFTGPAAAALGLTGRTLTVHVETADHRRVSLPLTVYARPRPERP